MRRKITVWLGLGLMLTVGFLMPNFAQAKNGEENYLRQREQLVKDLNLSPEKAQAFRAVETKYEKTRKDIIARVKKDEGDLETALGAWQPDETGIDKLVAALIADHDQLFESFRAQRQEEMALLTPVQRGKLLLASKKWHEERR